MNTVEFQSSIPIIENKKAKKTKEPRVSLNNFSAKLASIGAALVAISAISMIFYELSVVGYQKTLSLLFKKNLARLEKRLKTKFSPLAHAQLCSMQSINKSLLLQKLTICKQEEKEIIEYLVENFALKEGQLEEILKGAHVRLRDQGFSYQKWAVEIPTNAKKERLSSHPSDKHAKQYGVRGPFFKEFLFSQITEDNEVFTWFQLENNPFSFGYFYRHTFDYLKYKITGKQQGPYGSSFATHHAPIFLDLKTFV